MRRAPIRAWPEVRRSAGIQSGIEIGEIAGSDETLKSPGTGCGIVGPPGHRLRQFRNAVDVIRRNAGAHRREALRHPRTTIPRSILVRQRGGVLGQQRYRPEPSASYVTMSPAAWCDQTTRALTLGGLQMVVRRSVNG